MTPFLRDTRAWKMQVWNSFGVAVSPCATGLAYLPGNDLDCATRMKPISPTHVAANEPGASS
jgi:hypothetical protein